MAVSINAKILKIVGSQENYARYSKKKDKGSNNMKGCIYRYLDVER